MISQETTVQQQEFAEKLSAAQQVVHRSDIRSRIPVALSRLLAVLTICFCLYGVLRVACALTCSSIPLGWTGFIGIAFLLSIVPATVTMIAAYRLKPCLVEVAERLDLAENTHNRIATGLYFLESNIRTPFTRAAIRDGEICLDRIRGKRPYLDNSVFRIKGAGGYVAVIVVFWVIALICDGMWISPNESQGLIVSVVDVEGDAEQVNVEADKTEEKKTPERDSMKSRSVTEKSEAKENRSTESSAGKRGDEKSEGQGGQGSSEDSQLTSQLSSSGGESSSATASSSERREQAEKKKSKTKRKPGRRGGMQKDNPASKNESSPVSSGTTGGGSVSPVRHDWASKAQTAGGDQDDDDSEEEVEDENESNTQRGGVQPSLKDRNEAPSREMGLSGEEGPPGTGRGGPTPPKKSRGTASLVLGVPVPDFVKGRVGPGTTKIIHERVQPPAVPGDQAATAGTRKRTTPENTIRELTIPVYLQNFVRNYLISLHSADQDENDRGKDSVNPAETTPKE